MIIDLNSFLKDFRGKWVSQKNVYLLKNKQHKVYNDVLTISVEQSKLNLYNKLTLFYSYNLKFLKMYSVNNSNCYYLKYNKIGRSQKFHLDINLKVISSSLLKICCNINNINFVYEEYLYSINKNFKISIGLLKEINNKRYLGTIITSYIKVM